MIVSVPGASATTTLWLAGAVVGVVAVNGTAGDVELLNTVASAGTYCAVMVWLPTPKVLTESVAPVAVRLTWPSGVAPSKNFTAPVPAPSAELSLVLLTSACRATAEKAGAVVGLTDSAVVVPCAGIALITYDRGADVDGPNEAELVGVNTAVIECVAAESALVLVAAVPPATVTGEPMLVAPSLNWTVPAALDGLMVAVNVTDVPVFCGLTGVAASVVVVACATGAGKTRLHVVPVIRMSAESYVAPAG